MRVLVTFAVEAEFAPWRRLRKFGSVSWVGLEGFSSEIGNLEIAVMLTGIGARQTWVNATKAIWGEEVDVCISSGLAGGLRSEHQSGEVLVARAVHSVEWQRTIRCDASLVDCAAACGAKPVELFRSENHVVVSVEEKRRLGEFADAVDMESGDILFEASAFGIRGVAIRGISDTVDEGLPIDFNRVVTGDGDISIPKVLGEVARHPAKLPALMRFGQQSHRAAESLCAFLDGYVARLAKDFTPSTVDSPVAAT